MKRGYLFVFLAASMWGTLGIFAKLLYRFNLDPFTIVFYRAGIAFALLLAYNGLTSGLGIGRERLKFYAFYGFFSVFLFYALYFYAVKYSSVSLAVLLLYTAPIYSTIMGYILFGEDITPAKLLSLLAVIIGVLFVTKLDGNVRPLGVALGLLSGFTYALYGILGKIAMRTDRPEKALMYTLGFGFLFMIPFVHPRVPLGATPYLLSLAFFPTFLGYLLYNHALREVEASRASIVATIEPVVALVLAYLIFGETLTPRQLVGAGMIILGALLLQYEEYRSK
ncbi:DMT family transporter [Palaeococcus ferrophilus]|uniref:DMT family transporter n=1 Tax=Palaeococcus ferrophilus TaxID=83868 RepID=UPI00064EBD88|nr:EamA family transporter [Palaeococcus ferrophilus]